MAWDATRPVPWRRLIREWLIYVAIMAAVFLLLMRDTSIVGLMAGLLVSGPLYILFGAVMAKFGYTRKTMKQLRSETPERTKKPASSPADVDGPKPKPAPTKRTSGTASGRPGGQRAKRR